MNCYKYVLYLVALALCCFIISHYITQPVQHEPFIPKPVKQFYRPYIRHATNTYADFMSKFSIEHFINKLRKFNIY